MSSAAPTCVYTRLPDHGFISRLVSLWRLSPEKGNVTKPGGGLCANTAQPYSGEANLDQVHARRERYLKRGFGRTGRKLLGHHHLNTTQIYARIYDETLYEQLKTAMSRLEAIAVDE
jgi:hypothetical protein